MEIKSTAFKEGGMIPRKYTCDDINTSPSLEFSQIPAGTKSIAIICEDPDAPSGNFVHWLFYDIPENVTNIPEAIKPERTPSIGGKQGTNDFRKIGYRGPCPPSGTHRYFFKLYALDSMLEVSPGLNRQQLFNAMRGHVISEAELMGKYKR